MYRQFWLENQEGKIWNFTDKETKTFLNTPSGLGFEMNYSDHRVGNSMIITDEEHRLTDVQGTLLFHGNNSVDIYEDYYQFVKFLGKNEKLKLHYKTPNSFDSYYRHCFVSRLDKSEISTDGIMRCSITFAVKSFWKNDNPNVLFIENTAPTDGKQYELERPYYYPANNLSNIRIINKGTVETSLKIVITGRTVNPTFRLYDSDFEQYGVIKMIGEFDKVIVDSDDLNENIELQKNGFPLPAPYSYQDFSLGKKDKIKVTFLKIHSGVSFASFTSDDTFDGSIRLEWSDEYGSV